MDMPAAASLELFKDVNFAKVHPDGFIDFMANISEIFFMTLFKAEIAEMKNG